MHPFGADAKLLQYLHSETTGAETSESPDSQLFITAGNSFPAAPWLLQPTLLPILHLGSSEITCSLSAAWTARL